MLDKEYSIADKGSRDETSRINDVIYDEDNRQVFINKYYSNQKSVVVIVDLDSFENVRKFDAIQGI